MLHSGEKNYLTCISDSEQSKDCDCFTKRKAILFLRKVRRKCCIIGTLEDKFTYFLIYKLRKKTTKNDMGKQH